MLNLILTVLAIVSGISFTVMIVSFVNSTKKRKHYSRCMGRIQRIWKRRSPGGPANQQLISPIVSYTVCGKTYEIVGTSYSKKIEIGQEVVVLFDENAPSKAIMKKGMYFMSVLSGIVGLAFAVGFLILTALNHVGLLSF